MIERARKHGARRGVALVEALIGGAMLAAGLAVLVSLSGRSLASQSLGEDRIIAAALLDELLSGVLSEGPEKYQNTFDLSGRFEPPFDDYRYIIDIRSQGEIEPYFVSATVLWIANGHERSETIDTMIAEKRGDETIELREPGTPILR